MFQIQYENGKSWSGGIFSPWEQNALIALQIHSVKVLNSHVCLPLKSGHKMGCYFFLYQLHTVNDKIYKFDNLEKMGIVSGPRSFWIGKYSIYNVGIKYMSQSLDYWLTWKHGHSFNAPRLRVHKQHFNHKIYMYVTNKALLLILKEWTWILCPETLQYKVSFQLYLSLSNIYNM